MTQSIVLIMVSYEDGDLENFGHMISYSAPNPMLPNSAMCSV